MKQRRLTVLLLVLVALLALRWWDPIGRPVNSEIAQAVVRPTLPASASAEQGGTTGLVPAQHREPSALVDVASVLASHADLPGLLRSLRGQLERLVRANRHVRVGVCVYQQRSPLSRA